MSNFLTQFKYFKPDFYITLGRIYPKTVSIYKTVWPPRHVYPNNSIFLHRYISAISLPSILWTLTVLDNHLSLRLNFSPRQFQLCTLIYTSLCHIWGVGLTVCMLAVHFLQRGGSNFFKEGKHFLLQLCSATLFVCFLLSFFLLQVCSATLFVCFLLSFFLLQLCSATLFVCFLLSFFLL